MDGWAGELRDWKPAFPISIPVFIERSTKQKARTHDIEIYLDSGTVGSYIMLPLVPKKEDGWMNADATRGHFLEVSLLIARE
jgi:hypothetical protein